MYITCNRYISLPSKILLCMLQLAALHFNENASRGQAVTRQGKEQFSITFPKYKKGEYIVKKVLKDPTYGNYILQLVEIIT